MNINNGGIFGLQQDVVLNTVGLIAPRITASTGTGITVVDAGSICRVVYKSTVTYAAFSASATHGHATIATLPAKTKICAFYADTTTKYKDAGTTISVAAMVVGIQDAGAEIIATHDVFAGAILRGMADADMGTGLTIAAAIQGGYLISWSATTPIIATLALTGGNTSILTQGSTTFYIVTEQYL